MGFGSFGQMRASETSHWASALLTFVGSCGALQWPVGMETAVRFGINSRISLPSGGLRTVSHQESKSAEKNNTGISRRPPFTERLVYSAFALPFMYNESGPKKPFRV